MNNNKIRFMDLFSGIGGFRHGLEQSGNEFECVLSCEVDSRARETYSLLYNLDVQYCKFNADEHSKDKELFAEDVEDLASLTKEEFCQMWDCNPTDNSLIDLVCGGFPCQPFSRSGKRKAFKDENKGNLFFSLLEIIQKTKPKQILLENVKGLLTVGENVIVDDEKLFGYGIRKIEIDKGRTFLDIINMLIGEGYTVEWQVLNSDKVIPHKRERVFIHCYMEAEENRSLFPIVVNENQELEYIEIAEMINHSRNIELLKNDELAFRYELSQDNEYSELKIYMGEEYYEFGKTTPFKNWGRAFELNGDRYVITQKINDNQISNKTKLKSVLSKDLNKMKNYNLKHIDVVKQIWSKSAKVVATGNKMGNMNFPDSPEKASRTLTATGTLGREIMVIGYFISEGDIQYVLPLDNREELLYIYNKSMDNEEYGVLKEKFKSSGNLVLKKSRKKTRLIEIEYMNERGMHKKELIYDLTNGTGEIENNNLYFRTLTTEEYWRLQGFLPKDSTIEQYYENLNTNIKDFETLERVIGGVSLRKQAGNAVTVDLIKTLGEKILSKHTLERK